MDEKEELRIVLLGKTGIGKSSVGNAILGENVFKAECSSTSVTQNCERQEKVINGRKIVVIDTPGFFDTNRSEEEVKKEIISSLVECTPGPHVFVLVLRIERHTEENQQAVEKMLDYFTDSIFPHMILLFTHGDDLDENMKIEQFLNQPKCNLKEVAKKFGGRVNVIDNKHWNVSSNDSAQLNNVKAEGQNERNKQPINEYRSNRYQINQLMKNTQKILDLTDRKHYINKTLEETGKAIKVEVENILKEMGVERERADMVEIRKRAKERVRNKLWKKVVGVSVGVLLGGLLGVGVGIVGPVVITASLIRGIYREITSKAPPGLETFSKVYFGTALSMAGTVTVGLAAGLGATLGAGGGVLFGAVGGGASGCEEAKEAPNATQAAKKAAQTAFQNAGEILKECWHAGDIYTAEDCEALIDENNKKQE